MALIQKQAIQNYWEAVRPSGIDITYCFAITSFVVVALLLPTILDQYNTFGAREMAMSGFGSAMGKFLLHIDELSFTNNLVTFMMWGVVGMIIYGLISSLIRAFAKAELERELASNEYVHPAAFSRSKFWHEELTKSAATFISFVLFLAVTSSVAFGFLPAATKHLRTTITSGGQGIWWALLWTGILLISSGIVVLSFKLWRHRMVLFETA